MSTDLLPWIQNVAKEDIPKGLHFDPGFNSMLIQIVDPYDDFPSPLYSFKEIHKFQFLDLEEEDKVPESLKISDQQAEQIASLLTRALENRMNVVVHCFAGVCRSGAIVEVGTMLGFRDPEVFRSPNKMVQTKLMKALGL